MAALGPTISHGESIPPGRAGDGEKGLERSGASEVAEQDPEARPAVFKSTVQEVVFVFTATMAIAMATFTTGSVTVISAFVGRDLEMTTAEITWITSASSLAAGAFLLLFAKISDLFGRRALFVGSLLLYAVFALAAGFARSGIALDLLNGVMGLMSAAAVPPAQGLLGVIYARPSRRKNAAFACFSAGNPLGFVFGTIFSGIATQLFNWRASFYLLAIIYFVFSVIAFFTVPTDFTAKEPLTWQTIRRFDFLGCGMTVAGIGLFSAGLSLGPTASPSGWATGYVLALLIVGAALMIAFPFWENYFPTPLVPMGIWKDKNFSLVIAIFLLGFTGFPVAVFFLALYFQDVLGYQPLEVAVHLLPMAIMGILVNIFAGFVLHRLNNQLLMYVGSMAYAVSFLLFALNSGPGDSYWALIFPALILAVVGADLEFNVVNMYVVSSLPPEEQSVASGIFQTIARLCQTIGFGVATAIFSVVSQKPSLASYWTTEMQPYTACFWFATACAAASVVLVPFLTIKTQGGKVEEDRTSVKQASEKAEEAKI